MSNNNLFNFDDNFDPNAVAAQRALEKEALTAGMSGDEARAYAKQGGGQIVMGHSAEELEAAKTAAHQQGLNEGMQQGLAEGMQQGTQAGIEQMRNDANVLASQAMQAFGQHISELHAGYQEELHRLRLEAISIGIQVARRLAPGLIEREPVPEIEAMIAEVLEEIGEKPMVSIKVAPPVAPLIEENIQNIKFETRFDGDIEVVGDPTVPATDCRLDWAKGGAERSYSRMLWEVEKSVARYLGADLPDSDSALASMRGDMEDAVENLRAEIAELEAQRDALQQEAAAPPAPEPAPAAPEEAGPATSEPEMAADASTDDAANTEDAPTEPEDAPRPPMSSFGGDDMATFDIFTPGSIDDVDADPDAQGRGMDFQDITLSKPATDGTAESGQG